MKIQRIRIATFIIALAAVSWLFQVLASTAQSVPTVPSDVWIADRTDGQPGSGTNTDPYDGSTQARFDAIMAGISATNVIIHIGEGTFQTQGTVTWRPKDGWTISGAGTYLTTLQQTVLSDANILGGQNQVIGGLVNNVVVENLTVDCNYIALAPGQTSNNKAIQAVGVASGRISNVRVLHSGGTSETFALGFFQSGIGSIPPNFVLIENCRVEQSGPNVTAIWASNSQTNDNSDSMPEGRQAIIRNCYVEGTGSPSTAGIAFQINGYQSGVIEGCYTTGCLYPVYRDTLPQTNLEIVNNTIFSLANGITITGNPTTAYTNNVLIVGNAISAPNAGVALLNAVTNAVISNNRIIDGGGGSHFGFYFAGSGVNGITVTGNVLDASLTLFNTALNVTFCLNRTPTGEPVPGVPDNCDQLAVSCPLCPLLP